MVPSWSLITNLINYRIKTWLATWKTCLVHSWITVLLATRARTCFVYLFAIRQDFTLVLLSLQKNSSRLSRIWIRKFFVKRMIILKISSTFLFVQRHHTSTKKIFFKFAKREMTRQEAQQFRWISETILTFFCSYMTKFTLSWSGVFLKISATYTLT